MENISIMATEIELKAHIQDSEALKALLFRKAEYISAFEKDDSYWVRAPGASASDPRTARLRVRGEKRVFPDGSEVSRIVATYKNKEVTGGIEVNDELEFEVQPGPAFEAFLERVGFTRDICKRKRGWDFFRDGITAELVAVSLFQNSVSADFQSDGTGSTKKRLQDVFSVKSKVAVPKTEVLEQPPIESLGWFVELEILTNDIHAANRGKAVEEAREKLLSFLAELGISGEAIESRYYTEMLKEAFSKLQFLKKQP